MQPFCPTARKEQHTVVRLVQKKKKKKSRAEIPGGGGGFFLVCEDYRIVGECWTIHSPPPLFLVCFWFRVEISLRALIPLFTPGLVHSGSASWDDCDRMFPDELRESLFSDRFPRYALSLIHI